MSESIDNRGPDAGTFRIIVHASPPIDNGFTHWTEAPECPAAHDAGRTAEEAVNLTKERIRAWCTRLGGPGENGGVEFTVEEAL